MRLSVSHPPSERGQSSATVGIEAPSDRGFCQTFPEDPHKAFMSTRLDWCPPPPSEPTHHQMVIS